MARSLCFFPLSMSHLKSPISQSLVRHGIIIHFHKITELTRLSVGFVIDSPLLLFSGVFSGTLCSSSYMFFCNISFSVFASLLVYVNKRFFFMYYISSTT